MTYEYTDPNGDTLSILPGVDDGNVWVEVGHHETGWVMSVAHEDVPATALAMLDSAGVQPSLTGPVSIAYDHLRQYVDAQAEQAEREAEDAQVKEFFNALNPGFIADDVDLTDHVRRQYRAARKFFEETE